MRFKDKVVLVTGSSRGIGKEIARAFSREGAAVCINYNKSKEAAYSLSEELSHNHNSNIVLGADVSNIVDVEKMFGKIDKEYGKIDVLVNNAATYEDSTIWNMDEEKWDNVVNSNLKSAFNCIKFASSMMRSQNSGRIISISSVVGQTSSFGTANYAASKAGLMGLTRGVATELAKHDITANVVSLGFIEAGMLLRLPEAVQKSIIKMIPLGRWGKTEEVVQTVLFISSDHAGYITGQVINLNGGYYM